MATAFALLSSSSAAALTSSCAMLLLSVFPADLHSVDQLQAFQDTDTLRTFKEIYFL